MPAPKTLDPEQEAYAKKQYMDNRSISDIARELDVPRTTLQNYVNASWRSERVLKENQLTAELADAKRSSINKIFSSSYKGLVTWVNRVTSSGYELRPHEAKTLLTIIESLDKITRLDDGNPTDIISETKPISIIEVRKQIMKADPFQIEDAAYKEIMNAEETEESN